ncbi:MAG: FAD-binding oxidoreductase [Candidatus Thorarchaeota archaeon]
MTETEKQIEPVLEEKDHIMSKLQEIVGPANTANSELEKIVYSGDPSSLPHFHYRWKNQYLVDYVVRPQDTEQIQSILNFANKEAIPVIPRGGASSCMGSSSPTRGGISLDIKALNKVLEINEGEMWARVGPGISFDILEAELGKSGFMLGIYPSSAKSAVLGGWISCGGRGGIGTPKFGSLKDNVLEIKVAKTDGSAEILTGEDIGLFCGSYGILGVITEMKIRIRKIPKAYKSFSFSFVNLSDLCKALEQVAADGLNPLYLKVADKFFQSYSNPIPTGEYVLSTTFTDDNVDSINKLKSIIDVNNGLALDALFADQEWELRYDCEFQPKEHCDTLMFQEILLDTKKLHELIEFFEKSRNSYKAPLIWSAMLGANNELRVDLMALIDPEKYLKFISSKGILHKMVKKSIQLGGGPYSVGLQNSIYMETAFPERLESLIEAKKKWDPQNIMNPDRVVSCLTSFKRIDILFGLSMIFRKLSKHLDRDVFNGCVA